MDKKVSVGSLDLPPGYSAERDETGAYLVDPDGRRVMRLPGEVDDGKDAHRKRGVNVGDLTVSTQKGKSRRCFGVPPAPRSLVHRKGAPCTDPF